MKRSRWDTFDAADRQREEPYPQRQVNSFSGIYASLKPACPSSKLPDHHASSSIAAQETNEDELPPLPPDDPPPLPPPDEPGLNPSSNTYHPADSSHVTHLWPSGHQYGHAGQGAWIHDPAGYRRLEGRLIFELSTLSFKLGSESLSPFLQLSFWLRSSLK